MTELSMDSVGMVNPYMQNYYNDPYFLAAFNSPNVNNIAFNGAAAVSQPALASMPQQDTSIVQNQEQPKEKNGRAGLVLTGILAVGATVLGFAAHKKGNPNLKFFERLGDGISILWKEGLEKIGINSKYNKVIEENGCKYMRKKGTKTKIGGDKINETAKSLGIKTDSNIEFGSECTEFVRAKFKYNNNEYYVNKNKLLVKDGAGYKLQPESDDVLKQIAEKVKLNEIPEGTTVSEFVFDHKNNGTILRYVCNANKPTTLKMIITDRHVVS